MEEQLKKLFEFGEMRVKTIISILFKIGLVIAALLAYQTGRVVYLTYTYETSVQYGQMYTVEAVPHLPLAIFIAIVLFLVYCFLWKLICELMYIFFSYFESKNNEER